MTKGRSEINEGPSCRIRDQPLNAVKNQQAQVFADGIRPTTEEAFPRDILGSHGFVVLYFWAEGYGPCQRMTLVLNAISIKYVGLVQFFEMNVDANKILPNELGIAIIPTMVMLKDGDFMESIAGAHTFDQLRVFLNRHISATS